jgi:exopolysaccharide production protein ExoY
LDAVQRHVAEDGEIVRAVFQSAPVLILVHHGIEPIIYKHIRIGYRGRHFVCFKFRTMVVDSENVLKALLEDDPDAQAEWQRSQKLVDDPRITRVGYVLKRSCIDELPQLISVLRQYPWRDPGSSSFVQGQAHGGS